MGYRSQVRSLIYGSEDDMLAFIARLRLSDSTVFSSFGDALTQYSIDEMYFLDLSSGDSSWKWYSSYPEVLAWRAVLELVEEMGGSLNAEFVRVGENSDDIETEYLGANPQYHLSTHTAITSDLPCDPTSQQPDERTTT